MHDNIILLTDSYKLTHHKQYPPGITEVFSYFESRGGRFPYTVFFGLQYVIKKHLLGKVVTEEKIAEAKEVCSAHFGYNTFFNEEGWRYILNEYDGHLPIEIKAVSEGSIVPVKNVLFTVVNTDPKCFWLTGHVETILVQVWYPMTVATNSRIQKQIISIYLEETHENTDSLNFKLHDFGYRGCSSVESAGIGAGAHLVNFKGTDSLAAVMMMRQFYHHSMAGVSIPASEHSTITAWGREGELEAYRNMLTQFPGGNISCVSDSYNIWECIEKFWGDELKVDVIKRAQNGGGLVVRPDSGDPPTVVLKCLEGLGMAFGTTDNSKGYKVLPKHVRIIQGDGISYKTLSKILDVMKSNKWSAENITFGSGGALLQKVDRDTQKCAYKCSEVRFSSGERRPVYKDPITDPGKMSKKGRLALVKVRGEYTTVDEEEAAPGENLLQTVFKNGKMVKEYSLDEIRARAELCKQTDIDIMKFLEEDALKNSVKVVKS